MQAIVSTLSNVMGFAGSLLSALWAGVLVVLDAVAAGFAMLLGHGFMFAVDLVFAVVMAVTSIIPAPPAVPLDGSTSNLSFLASANQYVPLVEGSVLVVAWLGIFGWRAATKFYSMIPGKLT